MKFLTASEAKRISEANVKEGINRSLYEVVKKIHAACRRGEKHICYPLLPWARLTKDDIKTLTSKGYDVAKEDSDYVIRWY